MSVEDLSETLLQIKVPKSFVGLPKKKKKKNGFVTLCFGVLLQGFQDAAGQPGGTLFSPHG